MQLRRLHTLSSRLLALLRVNFRLWEEYEDKEEEKEKSEEGKQKKYIY